MIIIDGPDGSGKSTLAKMLTDHKVIKQCFDSPKRVSPSVPLFYSTEDYLIHWGFDHQYAVDRLIFSELVYGPLMRGKCEFTHLQAMKMLDMVFLSGSIIIFCLPDVNSLIFKRDESPEVIAKIREIHADYGLWSIVCRSMSRQPSRIIRYQWNLPQSFDVLVSTIRRLQ